MRSIFAARGEKRGREIPVPGDLIRNPDSGNFINIVIETYPCNNQFTYFRDKIAVRSVRYGNTNGGDFQLLNGRRSRLIYFDPDWVSHWEIVDEYRLFDNSETRKAIVEELKDVDTAWRPPVDPAESDGDEESSDGENY